MDVPKMILPELVTVSQTGSALTVGTASDVGGTDVGGAAVGSGAGVGAGAQAANSIPTSNNTDNTSLAFIRSLLVDESSLEVPERDWMIGWQ